MEDPRQCKVDVATLTGLSDAQKNALKTIYGETQEQGRRDLSGAAVRRGRRRRPDGRRGSSASTRR